MRDFLWNYFSLTGEIDAYLLYKQQENVGLDRKTEHDLGTDSQEHKERE